MRPSGVVTGSYLPVLWPLLTPVLARRSSRTAPPFIAEEPGAQASLSKNVNSCCTTGPFISGVERRAALCRASSPAPSTLYGLSVRRLISFDLRLPSHGTSRSRSCFGLVLASCCLPFMKASVTAFPHRGLPARRSLGDSGAPHQFTPMSGAHKADAPNPAIAPLLRIVGQWRGVGDLQRSTVHAL